MVCENHILKRFAPQLFGIGYPFDGEGGECATKAEA